MDKSNSIENQDIYVSCESPAPKNESAANGGQKVIFLQREAILWDDLNSKFGKVKPKSVAICDSFVTYIKNTSKSFSFINLLISFFPIVSWLRKYSIKDNLFNDIIAGFTISILHIPQGIAYGLLAGLDPVHGLYVSFFPVIIYAFLGTSRHISIGSFAIASIMLNNAAAKLGAVNDDSSLVNGNFTNWPPTTLEALTAICVTSGLLQILMGLLHLGIISLILSDHLVSGFSTGVAFHVATSQLSNLFGFSLQHSHRGPLKLLFIWFDFCKHIGNTNIFTFLLSLTLVAFLGGFKELIAPKLNQRLPLPIPIDLIVVICTAVFSYLLRINERFNVGVVGFIPTGLPKPEVPRFDFIWQILPDAFIIAMVCFGVSLSLAKIYAKKHKYKVDANQELIALGFANFFASFFLAYPSSAALSRSAIQDQSGGKTQVAGLVSCCIILVVLLFFGPLLYHLPKCTLSCIIIVALKSMFLQLFQFKSIWKTSKLDGVSWMVTLLSVIFFDVDYGIIFGIFISLLVILIRLTNPPSTLLVQLPSTEIYVEKDSYPDVDEIPRIKIFRYSSPLFYLNQESFKQCLFQKTLSLTSDDMERKLNNNKAKVEAIIIDCSSMSFIDSTGVNVLIECILLLNDHKIKCRLAACPGHVLQVLEKAKFFKKVTFPCVSATIHDAVVSLK